MWLMVPLIGCLGPLCVGLAGVYHVYTYGLKKDRRPSRRHLFTICLRIGHITRQCKWWYVITYFVHYPSKEYRLGPFRCNKSHYLYMGKMDSFLRQTKLNQWHVFHRIHRRQQWLFTDRGMSKHMLSPYIAYRHK